LNTSSQQSRNHPSSIPHQHRHASTTGRQTRRLRLPPAPSFTNTNITQDHIIFNPPSAAPNVYHTPPIFLPKGDRRRQLFERTAAATSTSNPTTPRSSAVPSGAIEPQNLTSDVPAPTASSEASLPPLLRPIKEKKYHITAEQVEEIRALRTGDPEKWTCTKIAAKYDCSPLFVAMVVKSPEMQRKHEERLEEVKKRWGRKRREAREDRARRRQLWGRE
ncbi:hypothetical protein M501DRAFT_901572, partial [Patellaria atrata CBS 101060]